MEYLFISHQLLSCIDALAAGGTSLPLHVYSRHFALNNSLRKSNKLRVKEFPPESNPCVEIGVRGKRSWPERETSKCLRFEFRWPLTKRRLVFVSALSAEITEDSKEEQNAADSQLTRHGLLFNSSTEELWRCWLGVMKDFLEKLLTFREDNVAVVVTWDQTFSNHSVGNLKRIPISPITWSNTQHRWPVKTWR